MPASVPARSGGPTTSSAASDSERSELLARIVTAADEERLALDDAGRLVSLAHRAQQRDELARIARRLDIADQATRSAALHRQQLRTLGWLAAFALFSTLMIVGLVYGLGPIDPH